MLDCQRLAFWMLTQHFATPPVYDTKGVANLIVVWITILRVLHQFVGNTEISSIYIYTYIYIYIYICIYIYIYIWLIVAIGNWKWKLAMPTGLTLHGTLTSWGAVKTIRQVFDWRWFCRGHRWRPHRCCPNGRLPPGVFLMFNSWSSP